MALCKHDTSDKSCGEPLPHDVCKQSQEHGELWTHASRDATQEHEELWTHESCNASQEYGELWTHAPGDTTIHIPSGFSETCCPVRDDIGATATSHSSGVEKKVWEKPHTTSLRDETLMPGPSA